MRPSNLTGTTTVPSTSSTDQSDSCLRAPAIDATAQPPDTATRRCGAGPQGGLSAFRDMRLLATTSTRSPSRSHRDGVELAGSGRR